MKKKTWHSYAKSRNIVNRVYDILDYFNFFTESKNKAQILRDIKLKIQDVFFLETLLKFLDDKLKRNQKNVEVRVNLVDLIYDLNTLKQYVSNINKKQKN